MFNHRSLDCYRNSCVGVNDDVFTSLESERTMLLGSGSKNSATSASMTLVSGFPVCDNFTIVGDLDAAVLQSDASLLANGYHIPSEEFCIERLRVNGKEVQPAKVFACFKHHLAKGYALRVLLVVSLLR